MVILRSTEVISYMCRKFGGCKQEYVKWLRMVSTNELQSVRSTHFFGDDPSKSEPQYLLNKIHFSLSSLILLSFAQSFDVHHSEVISDLRVRFRRRSVIDHCNCCFWVVWSAWSRWQKVKELAVPGICFGDNLKFSFHGRTQSTAVTHR